MLFALNLLLVIGLLIFLFQQFTTSLPDYYYGSRPCSLPYSFWRSFRRS